MNRPADGLLAALKAGCVPRPERAARVVSAWLADHLDALVDTGYVDRGSFRLAAAEIRAAGGAE